MKINTDSKTCMRYRKARISQEFLRKKKNETILIPDINNYWKVEVIMTMILWHKNGK